MEVGALRMLQAHSQGLQCQNQQVRQKEMHLVQYTHGTCTHLKQVFLHELFMHTGCLHDAQLNVPGLLYIHRLHCFWANPSFDSVKLA